MQKQLSAIEGQIERAKFAPDLKRIDQALVDALSVLDERVSRLEKVALEHAKLLDPAAFNEEAETPPAEASTDAPTEESSEEPGDSSQEEAPPPPVS